MDVFLITRKFCGNITFISYRYNSFLIEELIFANSRHVIILTKIGRLLFSLFDMVETVVVFKSLIDELLTIELLALKIAFLNIHKIKDISKYKTK